MTAQEVLMIAKVYQAESDYKYAEFARKMHVPFMPTLGSSYVLTNFVYKSKVDDNAPAFAVGPAYVTEITTHLCPTWGPETRIELAITAVHNVHAQYIGIILERAGWTTKFVAAGSAVTAEGSP